jgi:predicted DNA-binding transcriptional regulator AlpA
MVNQLKQQIARLPVYTPLRNISLFGISRSTALNLEDRDPDFPRRVRLTQSLTAYKTAELLEYFESRERV